MNLDQAIQILKDILQCVEPGDTPDEHDAIKLGIETLKYYKKVRTGPYHNCIPLLPGETK